MPLAMFCQNAQPLQNASWPDRTPHPHSRVLGYHNSLVTGSDIHLPPSSASPFLVAVAPTVCTDPPSLPASGGCDGRRTISTVVGPASSSNDEGRTMSRSCPPHGVKGQQGARPSMEDAYAAHPNLVDVREDFSWAGVDSTAGPCPMDASKFCPGSTAGLLHPGDEKLHFYGVYDGHGGTAAADHCAKTLHKHFKACLLGEVPAQEEPCTVADSVMEFAFSAEPAPELVEVQISSDSGDRMGSLPDVSGYFPQPKASATALFDVEAALKHAFLRADLDLAAARTGESVGTTAVVALVSQQRIWIAHCGDSRAVLSVNGVATSLTEDHKPERRDEAERVEKAGGRILFRSGSYRVNGMLAMSRALGDHYLRPYVIPEPEINVHQRRDGDEIMVIASDGLWDVFCNQDAVDLARRSLDRASFKGASRVAACRVAASVLAKAAIDKGSHDNVTVVVVDLRKDTASVSGSMLKRLQSEPVPMDHLPVSLDRIGTLHSMTFP